MTTLVKKSSETTTSKVGKFFGELYSFNNSLKLFHWHITGAGSYAQHMALDQALEDMADCLDRIVETSYAMDGNIEVVIPETMAPNNIKEHCERFYAHIQEQRELFTESFTAAILDDYQEAIQQLLYRLKRLK